VRRREVAERIQIAIAFGDLSENAEYDEAKKEQAFLEGEIATLEATLRVAKVVDEEELQPGVVGVGAHVRVLDIEFDEELTYEICGASESDPKRNKISNEAPIGSALLGKKSGDIVDVQVPDGVIKLKVLEVFRPGEKG
jgi:transcription elongation factor GreA